MDDKSEQQKRKEMLKRTFDTVSEGYDIHSLRFFRKSAANLPKYLDLQGNEHLLDAATGTGHASVALSPLLPNGKISAIDFSDKMLARAKQNLAKANILNVSLLPMDMQTLDFPDNYFDAAVSAFGLFFAHDMELQLKHITDKVKPGGRILITSFLGSLFNPLTAMFFEHIKEFNVNVDPETLKRLSTEDECVGLFKQAGLSKVSSESRDVGYYIDNASQWWDVVWNAGFRRYVTMVAPEDLEDFKAGHLKKVSELQTDKGIWLDVKVLYTRGVKAIN